MELDKIHVNVFEGPLRTGPWSCATFPELGVAGYTWAGNNLSCPSEYSSQELVQRNKQFGYTVTEFNREI